MRKTDDEYMEIAYREACRSLREGNYGFGAVVIDDSGEIVCSSHDTERTEADSTLHAELTAIRTASKKRGHDLSNCKIFCTHEPCPMCSTAIYWSGIREIAYSFTIQEALHENRKRLDIGCREIFRRAGCDVEIAEHFLYDKCKYLYLKEIREEVKKLRNKDKKELERLGDLIKEKRIRWAHENHSEIGDTTSLMTGYKALLKKLDISENDAPILHRDENTILFHSRNYCPTLEACILLGYDTRIVCRHLLEDATDGFLKAINPRMKFERNYDKIRPYCEYCEEMIRLSGEVEV